MVRLLACALAAAIVTTASAQDVLGGWVRAAPDGTSANGFSWRSGYDEDYLGTVTLRPPMRTDQVVGHYRSEWYQGIGMSYAPSTYDTYVLVEGSVPDAASAAGTAGYAALATHQFQWDDPPRQMPDSQIHRLPTPTVAADANGRLVVSWAPLEDTASWLGVRVYHSLTAAGPWVRVAESRAELGSVGLGPASCAGMIALRLVGPGGIETLVDSAATLVASGLSDLDADSAADACDNCVVTPNPDQLDANRDGVGDACDPSFTAPAIEVLRRLPWTLDTDDTIVVHVFDPSVPVFVNRAPLVRPFAYFPDRNECVIAPSGGVTVPTLIAAPAYFLAGTLASDGRVQYGTDSFGLERPRGTPAPCP